MENEANKNPTAPQAVAPPTAPASQNTATSLFSKIPHPKIVLPVILLVVLGVGTFFVITFIKNNQTKQTKIQVYTQMQKGDFVTAGNIAKKGLVSSPNNPYLLESVINANSSEGNQTGTETKALEQSKPYIDQALQASGQNADTLIAIGYAYETASDYTTALTYYDKAIAVDPNSSAAYFHKGHVFAFLNKTAESQAAYDKAYALDPNNPLALLVKGNEQNAIGQPEQAIEFYNKVGNSASASYSIKADALSAISVIQNSQGKLQESLKSAEKALVFDKKNAIALGMYGFNTAFLSDTSQGAKYIQMGIESNPRETYNYLRMGLVLRGAHLDSAALQFQKKGLELLPQDNTIVGVNQKKKAEGLMLLELAQTYSILGDLNNAIGSLKSAVIADPELKNRIVKDENTGYFTNIKNNPELLLLLK